MSNLEKTNKDQLINATVVSYEGKLKITYTINGKKIEYNGHNEGLPAMFRYICKALSGNLINISNEKPTFFDLRCEYLDESAEIPERRLISCMYSPLSLSNPEYFYDLELSTWVTRFEIVLSYNMLNFDIIEAHKSDGIFYVYILSANENEFARMELEDSGLMLTRLLPSTQAIIEWSMIVKNL